MTNIKIPKRAYIHHSADSYSRNQFEKINLYHKEKFGLKSSLGFYVGYNRFIEKSGEIKIARADGEETTAQRGDNFEALSVCIAGDMNAEYPTESQEKSLKKILDEWTDKYNISKENIRLHRDLDLKTECPGKNITHNYISQIIFQINKEKSILLQQIVVLLMKIKNLLHL